MKNQPAAADCKASQTWRAVMAISVLIAVAACSSDEPVAVPVENASEAEIRPGQ